MLEFSNRSQVFCGFYRGRGRSDGTLIKWEDVDVLVAISYPLILVEKSVLKLRSPETAIQVRYKKEHTSGIKLKVFPLEFRNIW